MLSRPDIKAPDIEVHYNYIYKPHELELEEKNELLFHLLAHLNLTVMRSKDNPFTTILVTKE